MKKIISAFVVCTFSMQLMAQKSEIEKAPPPPPPPPKIVRLAAPPPPPPMPPKVEITNVVLDELPAPPLPPPPPKAPRPAKMHKVKHGGSKFAPPVIVKEVKAT